MALLSQDALSLSFLLYFVSLHGTLPVNKNSLCDYSVKKGGIERDDEKRTKEFEEELTTQQEQLRCCINVNGTWMNVNVFLNDNFSPLPLSFSFFWCCLLVHIQVCVREICSNMHNVFPWLLHFHHAHKNFISNEWDRGL